MSFNARWKCKGAEISYHYPDTDQMLVMGGRLRLRLRLRSWLTIQTHLASGPSMTQPSNIKFLNRFYLAWRTFPTSAVTLLNFPVQRGSNEQKRWLKYDSSQPWQLKAVKLQSGTFCCWKAYVGWLMTAWGYLVYFLIVATVLTGTTTFWWTLLSIPMLPKSLLCVCWYAKQLLLRRNSMYGLKIFFSCASSVLTNTLSHSERSGL